MSLADCIRFEDFVKLLHSISQVRPRRADFPCSTNQTPKSIELVDNWFSRVRQYYPFLPFYIWKSIFRLLFPEEDVRRRYNMKEVTLARSLAVDVFGLSVGTHGAGRALMQWSEYPDTMRVAKLGCLGVEVEKVLLDRLWSHQGQSPSIRRIDELLDELASLSSYSNLGNYISPQKRSRAAILRDLFRDLGPVAAKFLTQIILKDLRPVLYPLPETHTTRALLHYKSNAVHILTKWEVMKSWNPYMPRVYRARATLDEAVSAIETLQSTKHVPVNHGAFSPLLGVPVEIPKCQKGVKLSHALSFFQGGDEVWAERKYDGERMQIHIDLTLPAVHQITIFSKSKRNSTLDRIGTHPIIRAALQLPALTGDYLQYPVLRKHAHKISASPLLSSVILDAEMVCYSESKGAVDEYWRLRSLVESTAHGIRRRRLTREVSDSQNSAESIHDDNPDMIVDSLQSNGSDDGDRHFKLVFFDVLSVNGSSLLDQDYTTRRAQLDRLITQIPGYVSLSLRKPVSMSGGLSSAIKTLAKIFSAHIADHQEGLVLKAARSHYNDQTLPWVKLKRDYIPGYGDTVDLVILGAGWNKNRSRELRVSPETLTTFFVAASRDPISSTDLVHRTPRFQILFSVEYGMSREQLETFNFYIRSSGIHPFNDIMSSLPYQFVVPHCSVKPAFMFSQPLLAELFGAGFTKDAGMKHYSLRFPRITKVWWPNERNWTEGCHLEQFQEVARLSIGHESGEKWANRTVEAIWGCDTDTGPNDPQKIAKLSCEWHQKLLKSELINIGATGQVVDASNPHTRKASSTRRKAPPTGIAEPSAKRQKLQADRTTNQPLKALESMTNVLHTFVRGQRGPIIVHSTRAPVIPVKMPHGRYDGHEGKCIRSVALQDDSVSSVTPEAGDKFHLKPSVMPPPPLPASLLHPFLSPSQSLDVNKERDIYSLVQPPASGGPLQLETSSSNHADLSREDYAVVEFPEPYWPSKYAQTPMVQFLRTAYVWIPRDSNNKRPQNRPPALELVPQNRRIGVIYFLLIICGCRIFDTQRTAEQFTHVDKCVIFVQTGRDPEILEGLEWLFDALESWRAILNEPGNKELFVFDSYMITYDSLATFHGDIASQALWRSSRI